MYFYPPLMFVISTIISFFVKINVAFKITTLLGTLMLPICVYLGLKFMGYKKFIPEIGAMGSIMFLFLEKFSIYGANLPSTLAGEFSYSFSFALFFLFIGLFSKGIEENKHLIPNVIILGVMALAHPFPVISATIYASILIFISKN
ncbi:MAG: 6-pyruvoyl-tetrahydropterin synthase-related protein [Candidatus Pacebacteria bacterium]|nr:6-pyruvoyl-tetrahydropterin synthase-related protein [Candidatus Paceibacterota bacterium]